MKGAIIMTYKSFVKKFRKGLKEELGKWGYKVNEDPTSDDIWLISFKGETRGTIVIDVQPKSDKEHPYNLYIVQYGVVKHSDAIDYNNKICEIMLSNTEMDDNLVEVTVQDFAASFLNNKD